MGQNVNSMAHLLVFRVMDAIRNGFHRVSESNYYLAKAKYIRKLGREQRRFKQTPLLIYQMGKVGSVTVVRSLKACGVERPIYHCHFLSRQRIAETEQDRKQFFRTENYTYLKRPWLNEFLVNRLAKGSRNGKWKVVSLTREPVARNLSVFFENMMIRRFDEDRYEISSHYYKIPPTIIEPDHLDVLSTLFFEKLNHDSPEAFFQREIEGVLRADIFSLPFPKSKGYCIYESEMADILLLRLEDLDRVAGEAFKEFMEIPDFRLVNANVASDKGYASLYEKFKEYVDLPEDYLDRMYGSRYMRHFYSNDEIMMFRKKWCKAQR
jgi:hypothetical protein